MGNLLKRYINGTTLAEKIRISYTALVLPLVALLAFAFYNMFLSNIRYESMINSVIMAGEFSQDFKKDFDYEAYLLIVENKTPEESDIKDMLSEAKRIVGGLRGYTDSAENLARLNSVIKYLNNLDSYISDIESNLSEGNKYEENLNIWENDVQIVTALIRDTMSEYIYYETKELQASRNAFQQVYSTMLRTSMIVFAVISIILIFLSWYIPYSITRPIRELSKVTDRVAKGELSVRANIRTGVEVTVLSDSLNAMIDKINELIEQVKEEQTNLRKAEFQVLQAQINPHFLYNTLDAIVWLAEAGEQKEVVDMVGNLSDFFRTSLNQGKDIISIREELQHVRSYLKIQKVRYQDILSYEIDVPEEIFDYSIPKITIQPLVENSLYHGIKNKRGKGLISIKGGRDNNGVWISVSDNGIGMDEERLKNVRAGIKKELRSDTDVYGLYNVNERIRLNFGEEYGIEIDSIYNEKTVVKVSLPAKTYENIQTNS
ncbi:MAG: sensor histidine kinase [Lachnospiraceae bacterium]|nr:sensor histidine kinase [Lachnospiraceae bacterium]